MNDITTLELILLCTTGAGLASWLMRGIEMTESKEYGDYWFKQHELVLHKYRQLQELHVKLQHTNAEMQSTWEEHIESRIDNHIQSQIKPYK